MKFTKLDVILTILKVYLSYCNFLTAYSNDSTHQSAMESNLTAHYCILQQQNGIAITGLPDTDIVSIF
jgi:hypothetical protein